MNDYCESCGLQFRPFFPGPGDLQSGLLRRARGRCGSCLLYAALGQCGEELFDVPDRDRVGSGIIMKVVSKNDRQGSAMMAAKICRSLKPSSGIMKKRKRKAGPT